MQDKKTTAISLHLANMSIDAVVAVKVWCLKAGIEWMDPEPMDQAESFQL